MCYNMPMLEKIKSFIKQELILILALILAIFSCFIHLPSKEYIDINVLGILFSLMLVVCGLKSVAFLDWLAYKLLQSCHTYKSVTGVLTIITFIASMFVTNDVALITFVPFAILILEACNCQKLMIPVIVLQTIAANLGSMLTPIGNPQNLYLFGLGGFTLGSFVKLMLPYSSLSLVLLIVCVIVVSKKEKAIELGNSANNLLLNSEKTEASADKKSSIKIVKLVLFTVLFLLSILTVLHVLPYYILVPIVFVFMMIFERKAVAKADYFLLLTFCGFFIFTGNIARIDFINKMLQNFVGGREVLCGVAASQVISNVPASLLLSGFSKSLSDLIIGVNLGGLGTLIASMASLISYKFYAASKNSQSGKYMAVFTIYNLIFLAVLVLEKVLL